MNDTLTDIFSVNNNVEEEKIEVLEEVSNPVEIKTEAQTTKTKKKDTVLLIQIALLVLWIILTALIYFFGYDLFEPFISV